MVNKCLSSEPRSGHMVPVPPSTDVLWRVLMLPQPWAVLHQSPMSKALHHPRPTLGKPWLGDKQGLDFPHLTWCDQTHSRAELPPHPSPHFLLGPHKPSSLPIERAWLRDSWELKKPSHAKTSLSLQTHKSCLQVQSQFRTHQCTKCNCKM